MSTSLSGLRVFLFPLLPWFLSLGRRGYDIDVPFGVGRYSAVSYSLHLDWLWLSMLIAMSSSERFSDED